MNYQVIAQSQAVADVEAIGEELRARDQAYAERWTEQLDALFEKLSRFPNRFAVAPESGREARKIRQVFVDSY